MKAFRIKEAGVSALWDPARKPVAVMVLAHGAGVGMRHEWMAKLAKMLNGVGISTLRFQFPYMEMKLGRPDRPPVAVATIAAAVTTAKKKAKGLPLFVGGKSFGGRMSTTAASQGLLKDVRGIVCFGFPLHSPKEPDTKRAKHLADVDIPLLWLQGTRDDLADLKLIQRVAKKHRNIEVHVIEGGDHSLQVLKSSGRSETQVWNEIAKACRDFVET